jgi:hypothetical protein
MSCRHSPSSPVIGGGTALASFVITSNSQVAPGTISGHNPPSGDHANIIADSINGQDVDSNRLGGGQINESTLGKVPNAGRPGRDQLDRLHPGQRADRHDRYPGRGHRFNHAHRPAGLREDVRPVQRIGQCRRRVHNDV